ncbi:TnsA endonuclease N-terminal domain-containing protein [Bacillus thuringiensis]|uniref:TnsA endonuclease N-terminal domain-containing protein n=1 Tax=Bacillus thuringiensis TaxID=1428 RepID=UPI000A3B10B1|nr:TnsA endonuclease N-terminal domain-containing protein [Bacillus thuringiensis]MED3349010.1 TnsA endonuclease N-terminal domain-containing protein [Bacillus thuringiensis]MRB11101.1 heteromeric transposase endonuclease subunit TnsA [Bacillus thuringiensis]OTW91705.1 heteromeric transposase endonuclease subunit TnsA [Bacillus thuringiensis serovar fukuokaensis]
MSKRKNEWTEEKIEKYIKEGRGQGELNNYKPWLMIQNVSSNGNESRPRGWKTNRKHDFLSNLERDYFFILEWLDNIIDIREQFPLDRELTYKIAMEKGISHSIDSKHDTLMVMTTDFLLTVREGKEIKYIARTVKVGDELEDKRVIEKFEIEREYWERKGIDWGIVTEKDISSEMANNISWFHKSYYVEDISDIGFIKIFLKYILSFSNENTNLIDAFNQFDDQYNLDNGQALVYFKHLVARKYIFIDILTNKINLRRLNIENIYIGIGGDESYDYAIG